MSPSPLPVLLVLLLALGATSGYCSCGRSSITTERRSLHTTRPHTRLFASSSPSPSSSSVYRQSIELTLGRVFSISEFLSAFDNSAGAAVKIRGVFAISNSADETQYVGSSAEVVEDVKWCYNAQGPEMVSKVRVQTFPNPSTQIIEAFRAELVRQTNPQGNRMGMVGWVPGTKTESSGSVDDSIKQEMKASSSSSSSSKLAALRQSVVELRDAEPAGAASAIQSPFDSPSSSAGSRSVVNLDNEFHLELTRANVDKVLEEIRPYLKADGGNVAVVDVDSSSRSISLVLQGACGSCPSSTTTMKMGIERILKENFADLGPIIAVDPEGQGSPAGSRSSDLLTAEAVSGALEKIIPAIKGMGGSVSIESVDPALGHVVLAFKGSERLRKGVELVVKDVKFVRSVEMK